MAAFDGYYLTGDGGRIDEDGYVYVMGRTDDVINVAGHRLSTGGMEEVLASHPDVAECAVIGVADPMKGQIPRGFVVLKAGVSRDEDELRAELVQLVRSRIGAVASLRDVAVVAALPKTRSGKILRKTMRGIADGAEEPVPSTIENVDVLDAMRPVAPPSLLDRTTVGLRSAQLEPNGNALRHPIGWVGRPPAPHVRPPDPRGPPMSVPCRVALRHRPRR